MPKIFSKLHKILQKICKNNSKAILVFVIVFLLARLMIIFFGSPELMIKNNLTRGAVAYEIMTNFKRPIFVCQFAPHESGALLASLVLVPFFMLFGESWITIRMAGIIFSLLIAWSIYFFVSHFLKRQKTAFWTLCWLACAPPLYLIYSTFFMGLHYPVQLYSFLSFILFCKMTDPGISPEHQSRLALPFGLICGFSSYLHFTFLMTLATCLITWFFVDKTFYLKKNFFLFSLFTFIGFSPYFLYNVLFNLHPFQIRDTSILNHLEVTLVLERMKFLFTFYLPHGLWAGDFGNVQQFPIWGTLLGVLFMISFFMVIVKETGNFHHVHTLIKNRALLLVLLYPIVFFVMFSVTDFGDKFLMRPLCEYSTKGEHDYTVFRYVLTLFPFIFIVIALFLDNIAQYKSDHARRIPIFLLTIYLMSWALSMTHISRLGDKENLEANFGVLRPSQSYPYLGYNLFRYAPNEFSQKIKYIEKIKIPYRPYAYFGFGYALGNMHDWHNVDLLSESFSEIPTERIPFFVHGLAAGYHDDQEKVKLEACGSGIENQKTLDYPDFLALHIPSRWQQDYIKGLGIAVGLSRVELKFVGLPKESLAEYLKGIAIGKLYYYSGNLEKTVLALMSFPVNYHKYLWMGLTDQENFITNFTINRKELNTLITTNTLHAPSRFEEYPPG